MKLKFEIGVRNLKTTIAVFISIVLSYTFDFNSPFLAAMSALLVMEFSVVDTFRSGKNRILSTIVGAIIGFLLCLLKPGDVFLAALGIILVISVCGMLNWNSSIPTAGIVFLSIMFGIGPGVDPFEYSLFAVLQTFLGIAVAFTVNVLIAPPNHTASVLQSYQILRDKTSDLIKTRLYCNEIVDTFGFYDKIQKLSDDLDTLLDEIRLSKDKPLHADNIKEIIFLYKHIYFHLTVLNDISANQCLSQENIYKLQAIYKDVPSSKICSTKPENIVFNYHAGKILDAFISLQGLRITRET